MRLSPPRRQELIRLPLLNNAKVKRKRELRRFWTHRRGGATPFPPAHQKHKHSVKPQPFCPAERASVPLNHILCLLVWSESKMSNLSRHNSLPHRSISVTRSHKRRRLNVSTSRQRGVTDLRSAPTRGLFTCPHGDDDPQMWPRNTFCFWPFCNR